MGELGDPRFESKFSEECAYLLPPMIEIPGGTLNDGTWIIDTVTDSVLTLRVADVTAGQAQVVTDGQLLGAMGSRDVLTVRQADEKMILLHPTDYSYFRILRSKLNWGRGRERN